MFLIGLGTIIKDAYALIGYWNKSWILTSQQKGDNVHSLNTKIFTEKLLQLQPKLDGSSLPL